MIFLLNVGDNLYIKPYNSICAIMLSSIHGDDMPSDSERKFFFVSNSNLYYYSIDNMSYRIDKAYIDFNRKR